MQRLEPEYRAFYAAGVIDEALATRSIALDRGSPFSVFEELRSRHFF
jgi:hypothetical protein